MNINNLHFVPMFNKVKKQVFELGRCLGLDRRLWYVLSSLMICQTGAGPAPQIKRITLYRPRNNNSTPTHICSLGLANTEMAKLNSEMSFETFTELTYCVNSWLWLYVSIAS